MLPSRNGGGASDGSTPCETVPGSDWGAPDDPPRMAVPSFLGAASALRAMRPRLLEHIGEEDVLQKLFSVEGKAVVVTGGSRGIGEMIARGFVQAGAKVYISARKLDACEAVARELSSMGPCVPIAAALGTEAGAKQLAAEIGKRESELHVLVNNAGANWGAPYEEFPDSA